jgi:hypothetical protein
LTAAIGFPDLSLASLNGAMPHVGQTLGVCFTQPTPTQIKVGPINFWPKAKGLGRASTSTGAPNTRGPTIPGLISFSSKSGPPRSLNPLPQSARAPANQGCIAHRPPGSLRAGCVHGLHGPNDSVSRQAHMARRRENPAAPIAKTITVAGDRNRGADDDVIRRRQIGNAREMDVEHRDQRSGLRELVLQFIADPKFQSRSPRGYVRRFAARWPKSPFLAFRATNNIANKSVTGVAVHPGSAVGAGFTAGNCSGWRASEDLESLW